MTNTVIAADLFLRSIRSIPRSARKGYSSPYDTTPNVLITETRMEPLQLLGRVAAPCGGGTSVMRTGSAYLCRDGHGALQVQAIAVPDNNI
jgi:hypothetical protein